MKITFSKCMKKIYITSITTLFNSGLKLGLSAILMKGGGAISLSLGPLERDGSKKI